MWGLFYSSVWLSKYLPTLHTNKNGVVINANKNNSLSKKYIIHDMVNINIQNHTHFKHLTDII